ncbi:MAG TPA: dihydroorotase [Nitrospiria bacterium]|nr:dihydroorotase [Nitrospiria bacterium]
MGILIKGGYLIDGKAKRGEVYDILIEGGKITSIGKDLRPGPDCENVIDATRKVVIPGLIDMHTHAREPGYEYKENIRSVSEAAAAGGFTTICPMPNTNPVNDNRTVTEFIRSRAKQVGIVNFLPIGAITKGSQGVELAEIGELYDAGCIAISDDGRPVMNSEVMRRGMEYARGFDMLVISHCEDANLSSGGVMNEGIISTRLGLHGIPPAAEEVMVARDILLAEYTGCRLHLAHISTAGSVRIIREAKARGIAVTAETAPHYFALTEEAVEGYDTNAKVNPPLRTSLDMAAVREGMKDGTIDLIATDHAPHALEEKELEFDQAPFGISGLETALSLTLGLVEDGIFSLEEAISRLTINPARVLRIDKGFLAVGSDADIAIIDLDERWEVDPARFRSKGKNSPFAGWKVKGSVFMTLAGGRIVFSR